MTHGAMLYAAALYNNGVVPFKNAIVGESYDPVTGAPRRINTVPAPTAEETMEKGWLASLFPFPRWELGQTGNPFRVFERGGRRRLETGLPDVQEDPGKPDKGLSPRGPGTLNRIDPVILGAQKTRLLDPMLHLMGTNDHPGDYRSSGCSGCHVVYANDRSAANSGPYAAAGNRGAHPDRGPDRSPRRERGHPAEARLHEVDPLQPVHDLPHAPGHEHGRHLPRLHVVGQRGGRQAHVPARSRRRCRRRSATPSSSTTPRARRCAGCGATRSSWPTSPP